MELDRGLVFPPDFKWGINLGSPHQIEGLLPYTDYTFSESGQDISLEHGWWDNPQLFDIDMALAADLGVSVVRLGTEWARVEPNEGEWDKAALTRYGSMVKRVVEMGVEPMLTLHHFTLPHHIADKGGWANSETVNKYLEYTKRMMGEVGDLAPWVITTNEPSVFIPNGYLQGKYPPFLRKDKKLVSAYWNLVKAHNRAYHEVKSVSPNTQVSFTEALRAFNPQGLVQGVEASVRRIVFNQMFDLLAESDFHAVNYFRCYTLKSARRKDEFDPATEFDREVLSAPDHLGDALWNAFPRIDSKPIFITENGINDIADIYRSQQLVKTLSELSNLIYSGLNIIGYMPWTLTDNSEWFERLGDCRMGLVEVDFNTLKRTERGSYFVYQAIAKNLTRDPHRLLQITH